jgi:general secretion pathway protein F
MTEPAKPFGFQAIGPDGRAIAGEIMAASREAAIAVLRRRGDLPIRVEPRSVWHVEIGRRGIGARGAAALLEGLALLLHSGVPLDQALGLLAGGEETPGTARLAAALRGQVQAGTSFAAALEASGAGFDAATLAAIRAGEEGGQLAAAAGRVASQLQAQAAAAEKVRAALTYPVLVLVAAGLTVVLVSTTVAPAFIPLFADRGVDPPLGLALLAGFGNALVSPMAPIAGLVLIAAWLVLRVALARPAARRSVHAAVLRVPRLGPALAAAEIGRFARALGGLLRGGVRLPTALGLARGTLRNAALAEDFERVALAIRAGGSLAEACAAIPQLPPVALHLLRVGERTAQLADALTRIAEDCERRVARESARILALLGPLLVVGLGAMVAALVSALLGAVLDANQLAL